MFKSGSKHGQDGRATSCDKELFQRQIDATDRKIEQLVYKLYGPKCLALREIAAAGSSRRPDTVQKRTRKMAVAFPIVSSLLAYIYGGAGVRSKKEQEKWRRRFLF
ncbi:MAG: hypothetical protein ABIF82_05370 [Planctomycetota bacterium]